MDELKQFVKEKVDDAIVGNAEARLWHPTTTSTTESQLHFLLIRSTMSSRSLSLLKSIASQKPALNTVTRSYVTLGPSRPYTPRASAKPTPITLGTIPAQQANASTTTYNKDDVQGNPETVNTMPSTAREIEQEVMSQAAVVAQPNGANVANGGNGGSLEPLGFSGSEVPTDWSRSYHGLSMQPFDDKVADVLLAPIDPKDVEMKPGAMIISSSFYWLLDVLIMGSTG